MFQSHPSQTLHRLFADRPYQGVRPTDAECLFVGLDANYAEDIEHSGIFRNVVEYHEDGAAFWRRYGVHHPFLLPQYSGDGKRYHRNFARIGFTPLDANRIGFVELLHVPTVGRNKLSLKDLELAHLQKLEQAIRAGSAKYTFLSAGVARLMQLSGQFSWLRHPQKSGDLLPILYSSQGRSVHLHLHFANYGKFQAQMDKEAVAIAKLLGLRT